MIAKMKKMFDSIDDNAKDMCTNLSSILKNVV